MDETSTSDPRIDRPKLLASPSPQHTMRGIRGRSTAAGLLRHQRDAFVRPQASADQVDRICASRRRRDAVPAACAAARHSAQRELRLRLSAHFCWRKVAAPPTRPVDIAEVGRRVCGKRVMRPDQALAYSIEASRNFSSSRCLRLNRPCAIRAAITCLRLCAITSRFPRPAIPGAGNRRYRMPRGCNAVDDCAAANFSARAA